MKTRRSLPLIILGAALGVLYHRLLTGEVIFWGTPMFQFYPWRRMAFEMLREARLPLWNPLLGNGAPLLANYQTAALYPPHWLYLILPTEYAMGLVGVLHLLWAGAGMAAYLRRLGLGSLGQGVGTLAFALSGYLIARFGFLSITTAVAWLPWIMWAVDGVMRPGVRRSPRRAVVMLATAVSMQLLAGHAQTAFYSLVLACAYALAWPVVPLTLRERGRRLALALGGVALGVGLAAVQLGPTLELMLASNRASGVEHEFALGYSFWPWRFLTLLMPNMFGSPATGDYHAYSAYWEDAVYVGLLALVMAARALVQWIRERLSGPVIAAARVVPFYAVSLLPVFLLALGNNTPIFPWLFDHVPGFDLFQAPTRWTVLAVFALAVLGAVGADNWRTSRWGLFSTRLLTVGGGAMLVSGLMVGWSMGNAVRQSFVRALEWLGGWIVIAGMVSLILPQVEKRPRWRPAWQVLTLSALAADLVTAHWGLTPSIPADFYHRTGAFAELVRIESEGGRTMYLPEEDESSRIGLILTIDDFQQGDRAHWDQARASLVPDLGMVDGVASANNFDPLHVAAYDALLKRIDLASPDEQTALVRQMGVSILLSTDGGRDLELVGQTGPFYAYRVPDPWPRVSLADCTPEGEQVMCEPLWSGNAVLREDRGDFLRVEVSADRETSVLLLDTYYPGWAAEVDGVSADIQRANGAFRAVHISPGEHVVTFSYCPYSLLAGVGVTAISIIMAVSLWFWARRAV